MKALYLKIIFFFHLILPLLHLYSQNSNTKLSVFGYISDVQTTMFQDIDKMWMSDHIIHNRLNMGIYRGNNLSFSLQLRNRLIYGETLTWQGNYKDLYDQDKGWLDLTYNLSSGKSYVLNMAIDRMNFTYSYGNLEIIAGRQRINWGQALIWNPNDIFNAYSYFDFDYPEKPGSDALKVQYYTGLTSSVELVMKVDHRKRITGAGLWRFNLRSYDFQILGGILNEEDYLIGTGWSGDILGAGFRGELTYLAPMESGQNSYNIFLNSFSLDYTFSNSLYLLSEFLFRFSNKDIPIPSFLEYYEQTLDVKKIAFTDESILFQASYPITPLFTGSITNMYFPEISGYLIGPNFEYSISNNFYITLMAQLFKGKIPDSNSGEELTQKFNIFFIRFKYNF